MDGELTLGPITNLFWNARERRLRAGCRLLVFLVMLLVVAVVEGRVAAGLAGGLPDLRAVPGLRSRKNAGPRINAAGG